MGNAIHVYYCVLMCDAYKLNACLLLFLDSRPLACTIDPVPPCSMLMGHGFSCLEMGKGNGSGLQREAVPHQGDPSSG